MKHEQGIYWILVLVVSGLSAWVGWWMSQIQPPANNGGVYSGGITAAIGWSFFSGGLILVSVVYTLMFDNKKRR